MAIAGQWPAARFNPGGFTLSIFDRATSPGSYDDAIRAKSAAGRPDEELFFEPAIEDLQRTADLNPLGDHHGSHPVVQHLRPRPGARLRQDRGGSPGEGPSRSSPVASRTPAKAGGPVLAAVDEGVPAAVIATALTERFASRGLGEFAEKVLSAMHSEFGGHAEKRSQP
ncbi:hypothetical protein NGB36_01405 [Streptomyces sp. RB6PN25]|uniref:Uncharacterized protein n=1 Tax=Streptomyces humicola TaxID=2953240 RepID=A0ABT1PRX0_9ACTN|nr:hypothetical protein [Streptomyces humicola]MCQ4079297.1 hypothetical protein [Streptomyces humicola]